VDVVHDRNRHGVHMQARVHSAVVLSAPSWNCVKLTLHFHSFHRKRKTPRDFSVFEKHLASSRNMAAILNLRQFPRSSTHLLCMQHCWSAFGHSRLCAGGTSLMQFGRLQKPCMSTCNAARRSCNWTMQQTARDKPDDPAYESVDAVRAPCRIFSRRRSSLRCPQIDEIPSRVHVLPSYATTLHVKSRRLAVYKFLSSIYINGCYMRTLTSSSELKRRLGNDWRLRVMTCRYAWQRYSHIYICNEES
jgi:hypothetical protein